MARGKDSVVVGTRGDNAGTTLRSVPREAQLHIFRLDPKTTEDMVLKYIHDQAEQVSVLGCEKLRSRNSDKYASFKITFAKCDEGQLMDRGFWPHGVCFKRFFVRKETCDTKT